MAENRGLGALFEGQRLGLQDVCLQFVKVDIIIELDYINLFWVFMFRVERHLNIDPRNAI